MTTLRKLRTSKGNIRTLLNAVGYKTLNAFMKDNDELDKKQALDYLLENYNSVIDEIKVNQKQQKQQEKQKQKELIKNAFQSLPNIIPQTTQKKSKTERQQAYESYKTKTVREYIQLDKLPVQSRKEMKALGGMFHEIIYNVNDNQIITPNELKNILENEIRQLVASKPMKKNLNVNIITRYRKIHLTDTDKQPLELAYTGKFAENIKTMKYANDFASDYALQFETHIDNSNTGPSNYVFQKILAIHIQISYTDVKKIGSYVETPDFIAKKKCCINIKNLNDDKCLKWCIHAFRHYDDVKDRNNKNTTKGYEKYEQAGEIIEPEGITYPIDVHRDIPKFEKLNNIKINVFKFDGKNHVVTYNSRDRECNTVIDLLMVQNHFILIKNFSRFMRTEANTKGQLFHCRYCLNACYDCEEKLNKHIDVCINHEAVKVVLPDASNNTMTFKNFGNSFQHPFFITADFEATLVPYLDDPSKNTFKYQEHKPNSFGLKFECIHPEFNKDIIIVNNENEELLMKEFVENCEELTQYAYSLTQKNKYFKDGWDTSQKKSHFERKTCEMCATKFNDDNKKCIHHDHINGKYLGTICSQCNLQLQYKKFVPIYLHNLKSYDSHFIVPYLAKFGRTDEVNEISCIPNNEEKYISFSKEIAVDTYKNKKGEIKPLKYQMRFLDTIAFMASSLESLTDNLKKECKDVLELRQVFTSLSSQFENDEQFLLMCEKGVYPYEYISHYDILNETKLPPINKFYSKLNNEHCKQEDYDRAVKVWKTFNCKTLMDYHNLYLKSDVLLLADIWRNFRNVCYKIYELDPCYYYTAPSLSWDAMMKYCSKTIPDFHIELITDMDMYLLFEKSIRGGLSQISKRYAKANNKYVSNYNPDDLSSFILYLDANNLYGYGMCAFLPYKNFQWNTEEWNTDKILKLDDYGETGFLFEVDLHYPKELHDLHNGYALCSENALVNNSMLNNFQSKDRKETNIKKLITTFEDKRNYGINYRYLKLALSLGIKLQKVHRVIQYTQLDFMKGYIMKNTNERTKAKNSFEKDFYKLMNNSVYGKTMENVRNRINFKLMSGTSCNVSNRNPTKTFTIFSETCVGVHLLKNEVKLNKPIFIGQNVLDESKCLMYDFHYNFMLKKFNRENIDLLFTDTDSLCYHIRNQDPYEIIEKNKDCFDLSDYPKDHHLYDGTNKKVIGKFKDEAIDGSIDYITEFVGLRSKLYAYKTLNGEKKKCKGVKRSVVKKELNFELYNNVRKNDTMEYIEQHGTVQQNVFRSYKHRLFTEKITKVALNPLDDKCYICDDKENTFTHGHYKIKNSM